jgi:hypothetical protein
MSMRLARPVIVVEIDVQYRFAITSIVTPLDDLAFLVAPFPGRIWATGRR